jgi:hypothetical protein
MTHGADSQDAVRMRECIRLAGLAIAVGTVLVDNVTVWFRYGSHHRHFLKAGLMAWAAGVCPHLCSVLHPKFVENTSSSTRRIIKEEI